MIWIFGKIVHKRDNKYAIDRLVIEASTHHVRMLMAGAKFLTEFIRK